MDHVDKLVEFVESLVSDRTGHELTFIQKTILRESLSENPKTYAEIAQDIRYSETYVKQLVAPKLWQLLSSILDEKVNKTNCRSLLDYKLTAQREETTPDLSPPSLIMNLESPEGQVPLSSQLYIERNQIESLTLSEVLQPSSFIRIKAPRRMGKTSLMARILAYAAEQNYHTVRISLQSASSPVFSSIDKFMRWFCVLVTKKLGLESCLDDYWDEDIGALVSSTLYFESYLLQTLEHPLVLAIDDLNQVFEYPVVAKDFLALLRSWHEETKDISIWQKLRFIILHSTDLYIPLETYQSPFNVGLAIELPPFNLEQLEQLIQIQGGSFARPIVLKLLQLTGGFPYLIRLILYHSLRYHVDLESLMVEAEANGGIYQDYLRSQIQRLQQEPDLLVALRQIQNHDPVNLDLETITKLWGLGLIRQQGRNLDISCHLYQCYLQRFF